MTGHVYSSAIKVAIEREITLLLTPKQTKKYVLDMVL